MKLCFGSYASALKACISNKAIGQRELICGLVGLVDKGHALDKDDQDWLFTRLINCTSDFPTSKNVGKNRKNGTSRTSIMSLIPKVQTEDILPEFEEEIIPLLDEDKKRDAVAYMKGILLSDEDAINERNETFRKYMGMDIKAAANAHDIYLPSFLAGLFLYSVAIGGNKSDEGKATVKEIKKGHPEGWPDDFEFVEKELKEPQGPVIDDDAVCKYLSRLKDKYSRVKTLLDSDAPRELYSFFIPNSVVFRPRNEKTPKIINSANLSGIMSISKYVILQGTGGLGKSMMMRHFLMNAIDQYPITKIIPTFTLLKDFEPNDINLESFIFKKASIFWQGLTKEHFLQLMREGRVLILLDGFDELHSEYMEDFQRALEEFVDRYPKNSYILSTRPIGFNSLSRFLTIHLMKFSYLQAKEMIEKMEFLPEEPEIKEHFLSELHRLYKDHEDFASVPLLLVLMLMTFSEYADIPSSLHEFYNKAFYTLAQRHDATKGSFRRQYQTGLTPEQFAASFSDFCFQTYCKQEFEYSRLEFDNYYQRINYLKDLPGYKASMENYLYDLKVNLCLLYEEEKINYTHRSFQEYFCALFMSHLPEKALVQVGQFFERNRFRSGSDETFEMLYNLSEHNVEMCIILPHLKTLFDKCDRFEEEYRKEWVKLQDTDCLENWDDGNTDVEKGIPAYWAFLMDLYPDLEIGTDDISYDYSTMPKSWIYYFVAKINNILHHRLDEYDFGSDIDSFLSETYVYSGEDIISITEIPNIGEDGDESDYYKPAGKLYEVRWEDIWNSDHNYWESFIEKVSDEWFPLHKEYLEMRRIYEEMEERCKRIEEQVFQVIS